MLIVFTTTSGSEEAESLARSIVEARLAACVQVLPKMKSFYVWKGEVQVADEHLLLVKTDRSGYDELEAFIKANHSYETPEIVAVESERVSQEYASWLLESLSAE